MRARRPDSPCPACGEQKPRTRAFYYVDKRATDGLHSCCKACQLKRNAANGPRDRAQYNAAWWQQNKDAVRLRTSPNFARWRKENRAKRLEWEANYRRTESYRKANQAHQQNRRARKAGAEGTHTADEFHAVLIAQAFRCFYCRHHELRDRGSFHPAEQRRVELDREHSRRLHHLQHQQGQPPCSV